MGNFYHMVFYPGGGGKGNEIHGGGGGIPCDTGFNSPSFFLKRMGHMEITI